MRGTWEKELHTLNHFCVSAKQCTDALRVSLQLFFVTVLWTGLSYTHFAEADWDRGKVVLQIELEDVGCEPSSARLQDHTLSIVFHCYSSWPRPKIAASAAGDHTWLPKEEQPSSHALLSVAVVLNVSDQARRQLSHISKPWFVAHIYDLLYMYLVSFFQFPFCGRRAPCYKPTCLVLASTYDFFPLC